MSVLSYDFQDTDTPLSQFDCDYYSDNWRDTKMTNFRTFTHKGGLTRETLIQYILSICNELSKKPDEIRQTNLEADLKRLSYLVPLML